jgi:hypothetical protein
VLHEAGATRGRRGPALRRAGRRLGGQRAVGGAQGSEDGVARGLEGLQVCRASRTVSASLAFLLAKAASDDIHLLIDDIEWLDETERDQIFAGNAQQLFKL